MGGRVLKDRVEQTMVSVVRLHTITDSASLRLCASTPPAVHQQPYSTARNGTQAKSSDEPLPCPVHVVQKDGVATPGRCWSRLLVVDMVRATGQGSCTHAAVAEVRAGTRGWGRSARCLVALRADTGPRR